MSGWIRDAFFFSIVVTISAGTGALAERTIWKTEADARQSRFDANQRDLDKNLDDINTTLSNIKPFFEWEIVDLPRPPQTFNASDFKPQDHHPDSIRHNSPKTTAEFVSSIAAETTRLQAAVGEENQEFAASRENLKGASAAAKFNASVAKENYEAAQKNAKALAESGVALENEQLNTARERDAARAARNDATNTVKDMSRTAQEALRDVYNEGYNAGVNRGREEGYAAALVGPDCRERK